MGTLVTRAKALVRRVFFWLPSAAPSEERMPEAGHDHALILAVTSPRIVPTMRQVRYALRVVLSEGERRMMLAALAVFLISGGAALAMLLNQRTVRVPVAGGSITEAVIGEPKYLNPLDAPANDVDRDIVSLVFSGLFRMEGMEPVPDLAEKYSWSADGKTLTVTIRNDARFHNGDEVTADDVQFTIDAIQDPARTSRLAPRFRGVKAIATDERTIQFVQEQPDIGLLQSLTVGILPTRLWQDIPAANARLADLNIKPIGSGPYRFKSFTRDSRGFVRAFTLERWDAFYGIKPYLKTVTFQFYPDRKQAEDALKADLVEALAFTSFENQKGSTRWHPVELDLPQETVAFFNLKHKTLTDERVRRALAGVIDRQEIVDAWNGRAVAVTGPFPFLAPSSTVVDLDQARAILNDAGWVLPKEGTIRIYAPKAKPPVPAPGKKPTTPAPAPAEAPTATASSTELAFTIVTSDQPELQAVAETLKRRWSLIGARVTVEPLEADELLRRATRDRSEQIILTNVLLDPVQDLFPFWWSGQATDRGLNISSLADRDVDAALEAVRTSTTTEALQTSRETLSALILRSTPAAFLVRPSSLYLVTKKMNGVNPHVTVSRPSDRFQDLMHWYTKTGWRWK